MRGHADPASDREPRLNRAAHRAAALSLLLLVAALATGGTGSPLLLPLAAALVLLVRHEPSPLVLAAPAAAGLILLIPSAFAGDVGTRGLLTVLLFVLAATPGWLWRREARQTRGRLDQLDDILAQAKRGTAGEAPGAAGQLADLERALGALTARLRAHTTVLWDADGYHGVARPRASSGARPGNVRLSGDPLGWAWEQGMRLRLDPAPRWAPAGHVVVAERLRREDEAGLLVTYVFEPSALAADDVAFEEAAVYLRGVLALQEARAGAAASERRVAALLNGLRRIPGELELDRVAADLCETAVAVTEATGALVGVWSGEQGTVLAVAGTDGGPRSGDVFTAPDSELALAVRADTMLVRSADDWTLGRTSVARPDERWTTRPRALAALPLPGAGGTVGVLAVWTSQARALDPDALGLLYALAPYAALHMEHARAFGSLRETAERDPLTQLRNRRAFDEIFAAEAVRYERYGRPLALLMLDLDHFKPVNDRFGHEAGDHVLTTVARIIASCVRDIDTAARFGGEEFVVLLPETGLDAAADVAERIRAAIAAATVHWHAGTIDVTVSIGVSACPQTAAHPKELMSTADTALYAAKSGGRDCVARAAATPASRYSRGS